MSFIAKNPIIIPEVESPPLVPNPGTRGLFAGQDGWYEIDSEGQVLKIAGGESGDNSEILDLLINAPSKTIGLNEAVPVGSMPSICNFELKPTTPLCIYDLANPKIMPKAEFNGHEIPLLTTKGDFIVYDKDNNIKLKKYIDSMINISRNGWNLSDKMTQNGIEKVWSKKFYLTKEDYTYTYNGTNSIYTFEFDESDFSETGIPAKENNIPVATPCFYTGSNIDGLINARVWGGQPFPLKFSYNEETKKYTITIRGVGNNLIKYQLSGYSKAYIYYKLENPYNKNEFLAMGLEGGDTFSFVEDKTKIQPYLEANEFFKSDAAGNNAIINSDITPVFLTNVPQNTKDALTGFSNAAKIFNKEQSTSSEAAQDYSWIGDGDGKTDYTSIIQNKIKELQSISDGGTIFLGNGVYNISNFIELSDNIKLIGTGNTTIQQTNKYEHVIVVSGSNVAIKDLKLKLYAMTAEEKDGLLYNPDLTACIYINSNNGKTNSNYNSKYLDNIYAKNLTVDNVYLAGSYGFRYVDGYPTISNDYEHYRGCGLIQEQLFFNYATLTNVHIGGMYHGLHNIGGSNDITIFCESCKTMVYGGGGYANLNIYGHSYYANDVNDNTISMSDEIGHFTTLEQSYIAEYVYDAQWFKNIFIFDGYTMNNRYVVSQIGGASYVSNNEDENNIKLDHNVIDYGRGNRAIENFQNTPFHIGTKYIDKTRQTSFKVNDPITQNALSGAGIWGHITSNDSFDKGTLSLYEICRYPTDSNIDKDRDNVFLLSALSNSEPTEESPIEILIDISNRPIYALSSSFIQFDSNCIASDFQVSFDIANNNNFTNIINVKNNVDTVWYFIPHQKTFNIIYKIKIIITKALYIEKLKYKDSGYTNYEIEYNSDKKVGICNIGIIDADFAGRAFLGECGGKVYGDLILNKDSTIKNVPTPVDDGDAVNKAYVDNSVPSKVSELENDSGYIELIDETNNSLSVSGSEGGINISAYYATLAGSETTIDGNYIRLQTYLDNDINVVGGKLAIEEPVNDNHAASKGYVDNAIKDVGDIAEIEQYFNREVLDADFTSKSINATYQAVMLELDTPIPIGKTITFKIEAPDGDENQLYVNFYNGSTRTHNGAIRASVGSRSIQYTNNTGYEVTHIEPVLVKVIQQNQYTITIYDDMSIPDKIDSLTNTIDVVSGGAEIVPEYYKSHLASAINRAKTNMINVGVEGETFIFITDVHWSDNAKNSPALIGAITKELPIENVVFGGDTINGGSYDEKLAEMNDVGKRFRNVSKRLLSIYGNHDSNWLNGGTGFPNREFYTMMQKQSDYYINHSDPRWYYYFYMDNPTTKTRMIFLDTGTKNPSYASDELSWLQRKIDDAPSGYNILIFAHVIFTPASGGSYSDPTTWEMTTFMTDVCKYLDTVTGKTVRAIIGGHSHYNYDTKTAGGIPIILSDCDSNQTYTGLSKTFGTTNEQAFDIITVNYKNDTIYCTKVGRGSDRTITKATE